MVFCVRIAALLLLSISAFAQVGVPAFPVSRSPIAIVKGARLEAPFDVESPQVLIAGRQNGVFESWIYPVKVLSDLRVQVEMENYPVTLEVNKLASTIEVNPAATIITYSHIAFRIRQIMFAPHRQKSAVVLFAIDSVRPLTLHISFNPEMRYMWPAASEAAYAGWDEKNGVALLSTDDPNLEGVVGLPGSRNEGLRPYQERPEAARYSLQVRFDPAKDAGRYLPLIITAGTKKGEALENYHSALAQLPELYAQTQKYFDDFLQHNTTVQTPDQRLNLELQWAMLAIEKSRVRFGSEEGLVAGYYLSGNTARPGFGWYFGRDTLWSLFAVNSYGDFALSRAALDFLLARQRKDGKIMHEFSQSANLVDWSDLPYFYASADATPLIIVVMNDYLQHSGDTEYIRRHWSQIKLAYQYCLSHDANHDGFYDNKGSGHGWVESGPLSGRFQEFYLAALWTDALRSTQQLATGVGDSSLAGEAGRRFASARRALNEQYWVPSDQRFAFSMDENGNLDHSATIFPAVAMWSGLLDPQKTGAMLDSWASHLFSTDWGTRILSADDRNYDPIEYHNGSVWPLFTGWVSLAEYRYGRPLAGYSHLRQNSMLTFAQDPGYDTELLSGDFFAPFPRSSPHQMWSSAMVLTPFFRGTLGLQVNALKDRVDLTPQFPAGWNSVTLKNLHVGDEDYDIEITRSGTAYQVKDLRHSGNGKIRFHVERSDLQLAGNGLSTQKGSAIPRPEVVIPEPHPEPGSETSGLKMINVLPDASGAWKLETEGLGGRTYDVTVCFPIALQPKNGEGNSPARNKCRQISISFPAGTGYTRKEVPLMP